jgi:hypothetical protein
VQQRHPPGASQAVNQRGVLGLHRADHARDRRHSVARRPESRRRDRRRSAPHPKVRQSGIMGDTIRAWQ